MVDSVAQENTNKMSYQVPTNLPEDLFRAYDIRGEVGEGGLSPDLAYALGLAMGGELQTQGLNEIIVGRDGRISGPVLKDALCHGLLESGCNVIDIGVVPTALVYFATFRLSPNSGVMVTGSHNPAQHNGFKIVLGGETLTTDRIQALKQRILDRRFVSGKGSSRQADVISDYLDYVTTQNKLPKPLKIVIDCGNGVAGKIAPQLFRALGCEVEELYCEVDGHFPNHHPDPSVPENLEDLISTVKEKGADVGLAFDGDGDRLGVVTDTGKIIWPDRQMMLYSKDVLSRNPGAEIIFDVKCTSHLPQLIEECGGKPIMYQTGHSLIKGKMAERNAPLAGEMSGHIFFKEGWFGFDDGMYVGARLLQILAQSDQSCSELFAGFAEGVNTPELKLPMAESDKSSFMSRLLQEADFGDVEKITIDGLRVDFGYGWGLVRPSNTSPYLILRFEADSEEHLEQIKSIFRQELLRLDAELQLPF